MFDKECPENGEYSIRIILKVEGDEIDEKAISVFPSNWSKMSHYFSPSEQLQMICHELHYYITKIIAY